MKQSSGDKGKDRLCEPVTDRRSFLGMLAAAGTVLSTSAKPMTALGQDGTATAVSSPPKDFDPGTTLWYTEPAKDWLEAIPMGNGRMGAMPFGDVSDDQIVLNEDTLYAEEPGGRTLPLDVKPKFEEVVSLLKAGEYRAADDVVTHNWLGRSWPCYQPLGNLHFRGDGSSYTDYTRELKLTDAVHRVRYTQDGAHVERETFASAPDDVIVYRMHSDKSGSIRVTASFDCQHPTGKQTASGPEEIVLAGKLPGIALRRTLEFVEKAGDTWKYPEIWNKDGSRKPFAKQILYANEVDNRGMLFEARLRVLSCDGKVSATDAGLHVEGASEVVFALAMASSFNGYTKSPSREGSDPAAKNKSTLAKCVGKKYEALLARHVTEYQSLFNRVSLQLEGGKSASQLPTDKRRLAFVQADDPTFASLMFQFGRYLLIACSRAGTQPANLQGIWNVDRIPPWAGAYTVNINIQMNYWGAETANLSECHEPLMLFVRDLAEMGKATARDMYHRPGWVLHHNTSIWRDTQPVDWVGHVSFWPMGGGWFLQHLWEHYQFTGDESFLRETAYPLMKGAAEFYDSWLIEDENGHLLTPVSCSPENAFLYTGKDGKEVEGAMAMGCTLDMAIIRELFRNTSWAAAHLKLDSPFRQHLDERSKKLLPYRVGHRGQLLEWFKEFKDVGPRHNTSPYYPLYPSDQITLRGTPDLAQAEAVLMTERGRMGGGFPAAWLAGCWARLAKAELGQGYLERLYSHSLHPNLLNGNHDVFQIDANLGAMASTIEFLLQSHTGEIELLPALPSAWKTGKVRGLRARGGFEVAMEWRDGNLQSAEIKSTHGTECTLRYRGQTAKLQLKRGETKHVGATLNA